MLRTLMAAAVVGGLALLPAAAKADVFNFSAVGTGFSANGTLAATPNGDGTFTISGVSGNNISGPVNSPFVLTDNLLFPGAARALDVNGFAFTDVIGGTTYTANLYTDAGASGFPYYVDLYDATGNITLETTVNFAATTPEPSSWMLLATGMAGVMGFAMRKRLAL